MNVGFSESRPVPKPEIWRSDPYLSTLSVGTMSEILQPRFHFKENRYQIPKTGISPTFCHLITL